MGWGVLGRLWRFCGGWGFWLCIPGALAFRYYTIVFLTLLLLVPGDAFLTHLTLLSNHPNVNSDVKTSQRNGGAPRECLTAADVTPGAEAWVVSRRPELRISGGSGKSDDDDVGFCFHMVEIQRNDITRTNPCPMLLRR
jgi:hypothetical protein